MKTCSNLTLVGLFVLLSNFAFAQDFLIPAPDVSAVHYGFHQHRYSGVFNAAITYDNLFYRLKDRSDFPVAPLEGENYMFDLQNRQNVLALGAGWNTFGHQEDSKLSGRINAQLSRHKNIEANYSRFSERELNSMETVREIRAFTEKVSRINLEADYQVDLNLSKKVALFVGAGVLGGRSYNASVEYTAIDQTYDTDDQFGFLRPTEEFQVTEEFEGINDWIVGGFVKGGVKADLFEDYYIELMGEGGAYQQFLPQNTTTRNFMSFQIGVGWYMGKNKPVQ